MRCGDTTRGQFDLTAICLRDMLPISFRFFFAAQLIAYVIYLNPTSVAQHQCSGTSYLNVTHAKQFLTTPLYGSSNYPPKMNCYFVLKAEPNNRILVELLDVDLEAQLFRSCIDYVAFHEGNQAELIPPFLSFCGMLKNRQVTSRTHMLTIHFFSDEVVEARGVKLTYEAVSHGECDTGWLSREDGMCLRHVETQPKVGWADAQDQCRYMQANLASIRNQEDYDFMSRLIGHSSAHSWIGYTDADEEGTLTGMNSKNDPIYPEPAQLPNDDTKDCLFLDYTYTTTGPYRLADCRVKQTFICQKHNNWSTVVADSQHQRVRSGFKVSTVNYTIWLLILVALILLCIVFCILYQACIKKRGQNRVHSTESNRLVRGLGIMSPPQLDAAPAKEQQDVLVNYRSDGSRSQIAPQLSPVRADVHLSSADTNPSVLPKLVDETELKACDHQRSTDKGQLPSPRAKKASDQPSHVLPPLSIQREITHHSLNTREGSFLKSKRTAELFDRPKMEVLENVSAISLDDFWSSTKE